MTFLRNSRAPRALIALALISLASIAVAWTTVNRASHENTAWRDLSTTHRHSTPQPPPPSPPQFDPDFANRLAEVEEYLLERPGTVAIVVQDRTTGARWSTGDVEQFMPAMSTVKLAIAVDLLTREEAGEFELSSDDYDRIHLMLNSSDNNAADALWDKYGAQDMVEHFANYGLLAQFPNPFQTNWIDLTSTAHSLDDLMNYVLSVMSEPLRTYLVDELRSVASNQHWGVWGAGERASPGNKNGWSADGVHNSVGFAGVGERYSLSMMSTDADDVEGPQTLSDVAELLFCANA